MKLRKDIFIAYLCFSIFIILFASFLPLFLDGSSNKLFPQKTPLSLTEANIDGVIIKNPLPGTKVTSPISVSGSVPSGWMFEGQVTLKLTDDNGKVIAQEAGKETVPGSWMSSKPTDFQGEIKFTTQTKQGFLVIEKDNPSGLEENAKSVRIPITF